ncbi:isatin hydrolase-like [Amphiura filiformis]|uniref:isatin hydrolase-like n=1 Tax=Amphiura filiformis TaxID=82378 RepID=UPI003B2136C2
MLRVIAMTMFSIILFSEAIRASHLRVVDLSHTHDLDAVTWPGNPDYNFTTIFRGSSEEGVWLQFNSFQTPEHMGTHIDAPSHFNEDALQVHQIPIEKLIGPGVIINVKSKVAANSDYRVTLDDIQDWETKYNQIPDGAVVIMNSGWSLRYPNKTLLFESQTYTDATTYHFPGWHEDIVDWLLKNRNINVIGVDSASLDYGPATNFPVHQLLGANNITGVEHVANLDSIPESGTIISVAPFKLYGGSGCPSRVYATHTVSSASILYTTPCWTISVQVLVMWVAAIKF